VPPAGTPPTTIVTDARGRKTDLVTCHAGVPADYLADPVLAENVIRPGQGIAARA
jgi:hypothetical protein